MMEEIFKDPIQLSKGVKLNDLLNGVSEFHIDTNFKKQTSSVLINGDDDFYPDMGDSDSDDDIYKKLEASVDDMLLSCPEYQSFADLSSKMIDCIPSGLVKMMILEEGSGPLVASDAIVTIHYAAYFENAKIPFDSTLTMNCGEPMNLTLGKGQFIPGLELGLTCIKGPNARLLLLLQPEVAWGKNGVLPRIRPEPALFVISLYNVEDITAGARFNSLPLEEQRKYGITITTVKSIHSRAKTLYNKKKYMPAIKEYQRSVSILNMSQTNDANELNELKIYKVNSYTNIAMCFIKLDRPKHALNVLESLDFITDVDKHCKALFYFGRACEMLNRMENAIAYYKKALKLEPKNKEIGHKLATLDKNIKKGDENVKNMWQNAFKTLSVAKVSYDVDDEFEEYVGEVFRELAESDGFRRFDLPNHLSKDELQCVKYISSQHNGIVVLEEGEGKRKRVSVVRKVL